MQRFLTLTLLLALSSVATAQGEKLDAPEGHRAYYDKFEDTTTLMCDIGVVRGGDFTVIVASRIHKGRGFETDATGTFLYFFSGSDFSSSYEAPVIALAGGERIDLGSHAASYTPSRSTSRYSSGSHSVALTVADEVLKALTAGSTLEFKVGRVQMALSEKQLARLRAFALSGKTAAKQST